MHTARLRVQSVEYKSVFVQGVRRRGNGGISYLVWKLFERIVQGPTTIDGYIC